MIMVMGAAGRSVSASAFAGLFDLRISGIVREQGQFALAFIDLAQRAGYGGAVPRFHRPGARVRLKGPR